MNPWFQAHRITPEPRLHQYGSSVWRPSLPVLHKFTFSQSIRTPYILPTSLWSFSFYNLKAKAALFFMKPFCHLLSDCKSCGAIILHGLFLSQPKNRWNMLFLLHSKHPQQNSKVLLCINVVKPVDICSKISVNHSCWHHKVTTWIWEALLDLCPTQRWAFLPLLSASLPEWTIERFTKKEATPKQRPSCGFRYI